MTWIQQDSLRFIHESAVTVQGQADHVLGRGFCVLHVLLQVTEIMGANHRLLKSWADRGLLKIHHLLLIFQQDCTQSILHQPTWGGGQQRNYLEIVSFNSLEIKATS